MRIIFAILGLFFFGLGALGAVLPVLPTTPFLLLASFFFLRSSKRLNDWFLQTKLYKRYLANFVENREMTLRTKLLCCSPGVIIMSVLAFMLPMIWAKVALIALVIFELWYFKTRIKTIPTDVARAQGEARLKQNDPIS
ncbi:YbaN family protein [Adlercreutzia agrestimuris]|uniref:YbaN family protein n=1 Tax=Adlercreutzia agrestimuris TaxID=2941324 RepID=UPI0020425A63|nr:YbaN family protein [Adlercreutzia agrestimuris]